MDSSTKNLVFSKAGATITCPGCGKHKTYKIGKYDETAWVKSRGKRWCVDCASKWHPVYIPSFSPAHAIATERVKAEEKEVNIDSLMEMLDD